MAALPLQGSGHCLSANAMLKLQTQVLLDVPDRLSQDGPKLARIGLARIAEVDFVVCSVEREPLGRHDHVVHGAQYFSLCGVWAHVQDL